MSRPAIHNVHVRMSVERFASAGAAKVAIVLGSGLADFENEVVGGGRIDYFDLPRWPVENVPGHRRHVRTGTVAGKPVHVLCGRGHFYEEGRADVMAVAIETLKGCGVETLILTNAAGSLVEHIRPGDVMALTDHLNWSGIDPLVGENRPERFVDMRDAYDPALLDVMRTSVAWGGQPLTEGVYAWMPGPSFETPAQVRALATLGAHAVGMSTVPEVVLARRHGMRVAALSAITNMGAGLSDERLSHEHTQEQAKLAADKMGEFVRALVEAVG